VGVRKSQFKPIDRNLSRTFQNTAFKVNGKRYWSPPLLNLFEITNVNADSIKITLNEAGDLKISYRDSSAPKERVFHGKYSENGYWEVFLRNKRKEIFPYFPIIYGKRDINRIRLAVTIQDELIVDNRWMENGNILFIGAGDSGRRQSFFNPIK
jgi:hypothetical protein